MTRARLRASPRSISVGALKKKKKEEGEGGRRSSRRLAGQRRRGERCPLPRWRRCRRGLWVAPPPLPAQEPRGAGAPVTASGGGGRSAAELPPRLPSLLLAPHSSRRHGQGRGERSRRGASRARTELAAGALRSLRAGNLGCSLKFWIMFLLSRSAGS